MVNNILKLPVSGDGSLTIVDADGAPVLGALFDDLESREDRQMATRRRDRVIALLNSFAPAGRSSGLFPFPLVRAATHGIHDADGNLVVATYSDVTSPESLNLGIARRDYLLELLNLALRFPSVLAMARERARQVIGKGYTAEHDDAHETGELAAAAACYALGGTVVEGIGGQKLDLWPVEFGPAGSRIDDQNRLDQLTVAMALLAAEYERLLRINIAAAALPDSREIDPLSKIDFADVDAAAEAGGEDDE